MKGWKDGESLANLPQNFLLLSQSKFLAHSGDRLVSMAGVRAQSGPWDWGLACRGPVEDTADSAADLELWTQMTECASWGPAVCLLCFSALLTDCSPWKKKDFYFILQIWIILLSFPGRVWVNWAHPVNLNCALNTLSPESSFPLSLHRCWCVGLWQSL